jgi:hypothetical protein
MLAELSTLRDERPPVGIAPRGLAVSGRAVQRCDDFPVDRPVGVSTDLLFTKEPMGVLGVP